MFAIIVYIKLFLIRIMKKPYLMIHEFKEEYLNLPLSEYILTFDDGLVTPYLYLPELLKLNTPLIFNISTGIICKDKQSHEFITCFDALPKALNNNFENYMTWNQIRYIQKQPNCNISGHSHLHPKLKDIKKLTEKIKLIHNDTQTMLNIFKQELDFTPQTFCFPFNNDDLFYKGILKEYGFKEFLGKERIDINCI